MKSLFFLMLICVGCGPNTAEEYQSEGERIAKRILVQLERVESLADIKREGPKLRQEFWQLTTLMITAREHGIAHPEESVSQGRGEISEALKQEMMRVYRLEGCQEAMEELQRESLHRLDLHHKCLQKGKKTVR